MLGNAIYRGWVRHRRYSPRSHAFRYRVFFLWLELDHLSSLPRLSPWFSTTGFAALRFKDSDYLDPKTATNSRAVWQKVVDLGGKDFSGRVFLLGQVRCLGLYFSPVNFFYCYDEAEQLRYVLAEVSNTPWNERHYYLVPARVHHSAEKDFHVSPFLPMDMRYQWRTPAPNERLCLHIENHREHKVFDATLIMKRHPLNAPELRNSLRQIPVISVHIVTGIYWQALRLLMKRIPFVPYPKQESPHADSQ